MPSLTINTCRDPSNAASHALSSLPSRESQRLIFPDIYHSWPRAKERLRITEMQHRKESEGPFLHEFILVRLSDNTQYRFDRRPDPKCPLDTLLSTGSEAFDTVQLVKNIDDKDHPRSECLIALDFNNHVEPSLILAVCHAIQVEDHTRRYTIQQFNCYFFSWAIITIVARYLVAWDDIPGPASVFQLSRRHLAASFVTGIIEPLTKALPDAISDALSIVLPQMLVEFLPERFPKPPTGDEQYYSELFSLLKLSFTVPLLQEELRPVLKAQHKLIRKTLQCTTYHDQLREEIESVLLIGGDPMAATRRQNLAKHVQQFLWYDEMDYLRTILTEAFRELGDTYGDSDLPVYGEEAWNASASTLISILSQHIERSVASLVLQRVNRVLKHVSTQHDNKRDTRCKAVLASMRPLIEEIIAAGIIEATRDSVRCEVGRVRANIKTTTMMVLMASLNTEEHLFPDTLPISLRIPATRSTRLSRLAWVFQPESLLCFWRSRHKLQPCNNLSHKELQKYIRRRIEAHSRDARLLGHTSSPRTGATILLSLGGVWGHSSKILGGDCRPGSEALEAGCKGYAIRSKFTDSEFTHVGIVTGLNAFRYSPSYGDGAVSIEKTEFWINIGRLSKWSVSMQL